MKPLYGLLIVTHVGCMSSTDSLPAPEKVSVPGDNVDLLKAQIHRLKVELISTSASHEEAQEGLEKARLPLLYLHVCAPYHSCMLYGNETVLTNGYSMIRPTKNK